MRYIFQYILKILAKLTLQKYRPIIIGITGSVGKTSTKEAIYKALKKRFRTRKSIGNYNAEIGVPLTILGLETGGRSIIAWLINFLKAIFLIIWKRNYPEILVLEMAVDKPGDMKYLINFVPVNIGVVTAIGQFPSHLEFFPEKDKLVEEKSLLVKSLKKDGLAVLNYDDLSVRMIGDELPDKIKVDYYGFGDGADLKIMNYKLFINDLNKRDFGVSFKIDYKGSVVPIILNRVFGKQQAFAVAAAARIGLFFGLNLVEIATSMRKYRSLPGRTKLIKGIKNTWIVDDTYNASPLSVIAGLDILQEIANDNFRKIAVLGDMLELGIDTEVGHRQVGQKSASIVDLLFVVGERARFISNEAEKQGLSKDKIFEFSDVEQAALAVQEKMEKGDIVLIKGSRAMHLEKVVKEIMAKPEKAGKLLVG
ncbi:MAG: Mur ligase family protein [bacterium]